MKHFSFFAAAVLACAGIASAAITPVIVPGSPTPSGSNYLWSYMISVDNQEQLVGGNFSTCQGGVPCGTFFTIYDFAGYVAGSVAAPVDWTASAQLVGLTASNQNPVDNPNVTNLTFTYGGAVAPGPITNETGFSALSTFGGTDPSGTFTYQAQKISNHSAPDAGIGPIDVPASSSVPEPASMALIGSGLVALAVLRRKVAR